MSEYAAIPTNLVPELPNPPPPPSSKPIMEIRLGDLNPKFRRRRRRRRHRTTLCYVQTNRHLLWGDGALPRGLADAEAQCGGASPSPASSDWGGNGSDSGLYFIMANLRTLVSLFSFLGFD
ncbi:hypothetical protein TIFTF001_007591 [Ficus carica]|uniref:Uncharacterized protein n=1 Tax=Ficus carica TaxID=3494 RepID=A0AA88ADN1_FICCA|nr:hypothetical protein TIFTF001_007591 [Ficus carica]